jgi:hypothetical protein
MLLMPNFDDVSMKKEWGLFLDVYLFDFSGFVEFVYGTHGF